jgi:hypothetical protein
VEFLPPAVWREISCGVDLCYCAEPVGRLQFHSTIDSGNIEIFNITKIIFLNDICMLTLKTE